MADEVAYRIHVAGSAAPRLGEWFELLVVEPESDGDFILRTPPIDQAELRGLLSALFNLNVRVIAILPRAWEVKEAPDV
jgi:hypothetical protein